jgi:hypothetical protein
MLISKLHRDSHDTKAADDSNQLGMPRGRFEQSQARLFVAS